MKACTSQPQQDSILEINVLSLPRGCCARAAKLLVARSGDFLVMSGSGKREGSGVVDFDKGLANLAVLARIPKSKPFQAHNWFGGMVTAECLKEKDDATQELIRWIVMLDHAHHCREEGECSEFGTLCQHGRALLKHMRKCAAQPNGLWKTHKSKAKCNDPNCERIKALKYHFDHCQFDGCDVCPRARLLMRELRNKKRSRVENEVKSEGDQSPKICPPKKAKVKAEDDQSPKSLRRCLTGRNGSPTVDG
ncbi:hypothetical protein BSKO_07301 [Bryopsis sp. KO-2023]|nr:hypothetical protein BSKO_07301 [Bryopsis sp. KO-2023]